MWYNYSLILYILPVLANAGNNNADQLLVQTNVGSFRGKHSSPSVRSWLGVPFGASTTGKLRFQPPQAAAAQPKGVIFDATKFGLGCPQNKGGAYAASEASFGEPAVGSFAEGDDCLNLNIWSPTTDRLNGSLAAVMVWIYGGGGQYGGSAAPFFDGNNFVRDQGNVVLVSINYRTNIFGSFPRASNQHDFEVNNPGLLDQRLAVEWVHSKIHHFGGNASRITLFGESAGAGAVATWAYAYKDNPLVSGLIMQSGTETVFDPLGTGTNETAAVEAWQDVANRAGCPVSPGGDRAQVDCMQSLPWQKIQNAVTTSNLSASLGSTVDNQTIFTQQEYRKRRASGDFARLPILVGSNNDEGALLAPITGEFFGSLPITPQIITLYGFTCPAVAVAYSRTRRNVPVYQYRYFGSYPNLSPKPGVGAYHGSEISMVFGTYNQSTIASPTPDQIQTSYYMQGAWAAFGRDPQQGLQAYGWQRLQSNGFSLNQLAVSNKPGVKFRSTKDYTFGCVLLFPEVGLL